MHKRKLGSQGLEVSAIGLGAMGMSGVGERPGMYGVVDTGEALRTLHRALEIGINFYDTAEVYGPFTNEELLGRALAGKRDRAVIATKFGFKMRPNGTIAGLDSRPEHVRSVLDASLKRLQTDYIDLWYQHRLDKEVPIEETVGAMAEAVKAGKVRYLGLSEVGVKTLERAHAMHPISALQSEYSLWERNIENDVLPAARRLGIGIVPFSPLGRGFLSGTAKRAEEYPDSDYRRLDPRYQGANFDANQGLVAAVREVAAQKGTTLSQIALAWLLHQGPDIVPIPGTKRRTYLEENAAAADISLSQAQLDALNRAAPNGATAGPRYNAQMMAHLDR